MDSKLFDGAVSVEDQHVDGRFYNRSSHSAHQMTFLFVIFGNLFGSYIFSRGIWEEYDEISALNAEKVVAEE